MTSTGAEGGMLPFPVFQPLIGILKGSYDLLSYGWLVSATAC